MGSSNDNWASRFVPAAGLAAFIGSGEMNAPVMADPPAKVATDDLYQQKIRAITKELEAVLADIGEVKRKATKEEVKQFITDLGDDDFDKREKASEALTEMGYPAYGVLTEASKSDDAEVVRRAERILEKLMPVAKRRAENLRMPVIQLGQFGREAKEAVPLLMRVLVEDGTDIRDLAIGSLGQMGPDAEPALPALLDVLRHGDVSGRELAARNLGFITRGKKLAVPALIESLSKEKEPAVQHAAMTALGYIGPEAKEAAHALIEKLKDTNPAVIKEAIRTLNKIGPDAKAALPALKALQASDGSVNPHGPFDGTEIQELAGEAIDSIGKKVISR